ncbi:type II toxin-antitoxin system VapC family toxin [Methylocystis sp. S23]
MTLFVIDASILAAAALADEQHPRAVEAVTLLRKGGALAPSLLFFEIRNVLLINERRKRLSEQDSAAFLNILGRLPIETDRACGETQLLLLARKHRLTSYDAAYLELALRKGLPLATLDADLERAAHAESVEIIDPAA